jgi:hypothetical protein
MKTSLWTFMNVLFHEYFMNTEIHECSSYLKHHECPIISSLHLHKLFMNVLWINYESYSWNIQEHSRIHRIHDQFMNIEIHECSSHLQHHELSNKFIAHSWIIHECLMNKLWILSMKCSWTFYNSQNSWRWKFMNVHHIFKIMTCPIISSLHLHKLFMNNLIRNYEFY